MYLYTMPHISLSLMVVSKKNKINIILLWGEIGHQPISYPESWIFGHQVGAWRDSGALEFCYHRISAVKQCKLLWGSQSKHLNFFEFSSVSPDAHLLTKKAEDSGYEFGRQHVKAPLTAAYAPTANFI